MDRTAPARVNAGSSAAPRSAWARRALFGLPALALVTLVAAMGVAGRFDGLYGQDPYAYYNYAVGPLRDSLRTLQPPPPFFWPPGYPILVALTSFVVGTTPVAGVGVSLLMGVVAVACTALLAEEVWSTAQPGGRGPSRLVPVAAGLMMACHPQLWQSSAVVMADTTGVGAAALGAWALARYARIRRGGWLVLAAAGLAVAVMSRWIYGFVAVLALGWALAAALRREAGTGERLPLRTVGVHLGLAAIVVIVILLPLLIAAVSGQPGPGGEGVAFAGDFQVYAWNPLNALRREFVTADGLLQYRLPNGLYYAWAPMHRYYFTPWLAGLLLPGVWTAMRRRGALGWLAAWALLVYAFHAGAPWQNFRFTLAYLTPLAVLASVGLEALRAWLGPRWRWAALALFGIGLAAQLGGAVGLTQSFIVRKQADLDTVARVEAELPPGARLLTFNMTATFQHYSMLDTHELYGLSPDEIGVLLDDGRETYMLIDEENIAQQWGDEPLGQTVAWLRAGPGLDWVARYGGLTLYHVRGQGDG